MNSIKDSLLKFALERGLEKTFCPSEIARKLFPKNWQDKMEEIRNIADNLVLENKLLVMQKGEIKDKLPSKLKGPIRLRLKE